MQPSPIPAGVVAIPRASPIGAQLIDASCNFSPPRSISLPALIMVLHRVSETARAFATTACPTAWRWPSLVNVLG
jgi:hypothetical protein